MMRHESRIIRLEAVAYLVILIAAAGLRLARLDWPPISDAEARHALAASALAGKPSPFDPGLETPPAGASYRVTTALLFQLAGSSDAMARVLPAVAGVALCMLPLLARRRLGPGVALGLSGLLSISPELVTVSRQADPTSLACLGVAGVSILLVAQDSPAGGGRRSTWAAVFAALALTSGPAWVQAGVGLLVGAGLFALWRRRQAESSEPFQRLVFTRREVVVGLLLLLGIATGVGLYPPGATDPFESIASWINGWSGQTGMPVMPEILIVPAYEPILLVFGFMGMVQAFRQKEGIGVAAAFWALGGLVMAVVYPSRTALDLAWSVIPAAYLASKGMVSVVDRLLAGRAWLRLAGMMSAYLALAVFISLQSAAYINDLGVDLPALDPTVRLVIVLVGLLIWAVLVMLFGTGWSWTASGGALAGALFVILSAVSISSIVRLNFGSTAAEGGQLWRRQAAAVGLREMRSTLEFLSRVYLDDPGGLSISFQGSAPPSLAWAVREFEKTPLSASDEAPPVVLAPSEAEPALHADYLGQLLAIAETNDWDDALPPDIVSWWLLRTPPIRLDDWVLLVRADVATQGGLTALGNETNP